MAGWFFDVFVAYLVRGIIILWRNAVSRNWPTVSGSVVRSRLEKPFYGCMYVVVQYKYKMNWERHQGVLNKPYFYFANDAEAYVRNHPAETELSIRVDPKNPTRSFPLLG
jgi:Protein of unknown function (DUF3592)